MFKNKINENEKIIRNKARLLEKGFFQEEQIDYNETFAPIVRLEIIRIFFAHAAYQNFRVLQMNVKSVFLNEKL